MPAPLVTRRRRLEEQRRAEALRLREAAEAERLRLALNGADLALWDVDLRTHVGTVNERWSLMLGYTPGEIVTDDDAWRERIHPDDAAPVLAALQAHQEGRSDSFEATYRLRHRDGHWIWVLDRGRVVERDAQGRALRMVGTHLDISERVQGDAERQGLERRLREAQKIESLGTLAGGIAHDFNNILAAILGNAALARDALPPGHAARDSLAQLQRAALRARSLVQQILTFSRGGPQPRQVQPLRPVVEETLQLLDATLPAAVRLDTALADEPLQAEADATQLQQVLMNLCTNAWHALPQGRGRIEVGLGRLDPDRALALGLAERPAGDSAHLWVADDGAGMDAATRERLFDPFFTTKPVGQGTGLGLSVVHGIVRSHRGQLAVQSTPGRGSTFHVLLPLVRQEDPAADAVVDLPGDARSGQGRHVLVVDDDEVVALTAQALLARAGWLVTLCSSGPQALERLRRPADLLGPFDIVVSDHNMPEMSGLELAALVAHEHPALPLIISSGYISDELRQQAQAVGVRALLQKEHMLERLPALLHELLAPAHS